MTSDVEYSTSSDDDGTVDSFTEVAVDEQPDTTAPESSAMNAHRKAVGVIAICLFVWTNANEAFLHDSDS